MSFTKKLTKLLATLAINKSTVLTTKDLAILIPYLVAKINKNKTPTGKTIAKRLNRLLSEKTSTLQAVKFTKLLGQKDKKAMELFQIILHDIVLKEMFEVAEEIYESVDTIIERIHLDEAEDEIQVTI